MAFWKVFRLTLLLQVRTLWRCSDGLFFKVLPLAHDALLTMLHPLLENMLQTICSKLQKNGTGGFLPHSSCFMVERAQKLHGARSELYGGCYNGVPLFSVGTSIATLAVCGLALSWRLICHPKKGSFKTIVTQTLWLEGRRSCHYYITPTTTWHNSHCLLLHNSSTLLPVHELCKWPSYFHSTISEFKNWLKTTQVTQLSKVVLFMFSSLKDKLPALWKAFKWT
jgi:hypothetical protein